MRRTCAKGYGTGRTFPASGYGRHSATSAARTGGPRLRKEPPQLDPQTDFLTMAEVSAALKISIASVKRLIASGDLPSIKAGKLRRIRRSDLATWTGVPRARPESEVA